MRPSGGWLFGKIVDVLGWHFGLPLAILLAARLFQGLSHDGETG